MKKSFPTSDHPIDLFFQSQASKIPVTYHDSHWQELRNSLQEVKLKKQSRKSIKKNNWKTWAFLLTLCLSVIIILSLMIRNESSLTEYSIPISTGIRSSKVMDAEKTTNPTVSKEIKKLDPITNDKIEEPTTNLKSRHKISTPPTLSTLVLDSPIQSLRRDACNLCIRFDKELEQKLKKGRLFIYW